MWFLRSNKIWLSERFSLWSRYELLLLFHFLFCFNVSVFLYDSHHYYYFCYYLFLSLPLPLLFLHFQCFYFYFLQLFFIFVYIEYFWILNKWRGRTLLKVGNKDTETVSVSLMGPVNTVCLNYFCDDLLYFRL